MLLKYLNNRKDSEKITVEEAKQISVNYIEEKKLNACLQELESWAGMKFRIHSLKNETSTTNTIKAKGEKILPIQIKN